MKADRRVIAPSPQPGAKAQKHQGARNAPSFHKRSWTHRNARRRAMHRHKNAIEIRGEYPIAALQVKRRPPDGIIERIDSAFSNGRQAWLGVRRSKPAVVAKAHV